MTVETSISKTSFNGSGSTGPFSFTFRFYNNSEIVVKRYAANGTVTTLTETGPVQYNVLGAGDYNGGSVTLVTALAVGEILTVSRVLPLTQLTSIRNLAKFYPQIHEDTFDKITMVLQQLNQSDTDRQAEVDASESAFIAAIEADQTAFTDAITLQQNNYESALTSQQTGFESGINAAVALKANTANPTFTTGITTPVLTLGATALTASAAELNKLAGNAVLATDLTKLSQVTATATELNKLAGTPVGLTSTEIGYLDGVTSGIQTQINTKTPKVSPVISGNAQFTGGELGGYTQINDTGLDLSQALGTVSNINTLGYFEESTSSPIVKFGATGVTSYASSNAKYTVVGKMALFTAEINVSVKGAGTGVCTVTLPAIFSGAGGSVGNIRCNNIGGITTEHLGCYISGGILLLMKETNGVMSPLTDANFGSTFTIYISIAAGL